MPTDNGASRPTDYRAARRHREKSLLYLVILVLLGVGTGLIGLIWGANAALLGGVCLASGAVLIIGLWLLLSLLQKIVDD